LPKQQIELRCVMLDVSHVVQKRLDAREIDPAEPASVRFILDSERGNARPCFISSVRKVRKQFVFCECTLGHDT
jgi:hypothetical protein